MNQLIAGAAMMLPLMVIGHALAAVLFVALAFYRLPVGWAISLCLYSLYMMSTGYKLMTMFNARPEMMDSPNHAGAPAIALGLVLAGTCWFATTHAPNISTWWAFLLPLAMIAYLAIQIGFQVVLEAVNPRGHH
jgi:hypothetical protein